jgi:hypothetical protein
MYAAFPRPEYYDGSAPPAPSAGIAPIRRPFPWPGNGYGTHAGGSHVHCCPVDGLGTRLYPCGIAVVILSFRVSQCCDLRRPVVDTVVDGTLAA